MKKKKDEKMIAMKWLKFTQFDSRYSTADDKKDRKVPGYKEAKELL